MARMCIASARWRELEPQNISSFSSTLEGSGYRLKFSSISPDFIFNNSGSSVAFITVSDWEQLDTQGAWDRVVKMDNNFQQSYLLTTIYEDIRFIDSYFSHKHRLKKLVYLPVRDWSSTVQAMLSTVDALAASKQRHPLSSGVVERLEFVSSSEAVVHAIRSIPGLELHDAHSLLYGLGSIKAISQASAATIAEKTDLSNEKAFAVVDFFTNNNYNRNPVLE